MEEVAERLRAAREKSGLTQQEVADAIGVTVSAIGMYENGNRIPRDETKIRYAKLFKTTVQRLFF